MKELYYQGSKFPKSRRYDGFASTTRASFDMTDVVQHRERRHLVRHVLSRSNIDEAEPLIAKQVTKALTWVDKAAGKRKSLEIMLWARRMMLDTSGLSAHISSPASADHFDIQALFSWAKSSERLIMRSRIPSLMIWTIFSISPLFAG